MYARGDNGTTQWCKCVIFCGLSRSISLNDFFHELNVPVYICWTIIINKDYPISSYALKNTRISSQVQRLLNIWSPHHYYVLDQSKIISHGKNNTRMLVLVIRSPLY